ncbi:MAG: LysM peptidoglycan-binding domain-containing protein [Rhodoglobus sp.]
MVADILALNGLQSADVQPGQELAIPLQYAE